MQSDGGISIEACNVEFENQDTIQIELKQFGRWCSPKPRSENRLGIAGSCGPKPDLQAPDLRATVFPKPP